MFTNMRNRTLPPIGVSFKSSVTLLQRVEVSDKNNVIGHVSEFKPVDIAGNLAPFKSRDFSISSLESVGALKTLQYTYMSPMSNTKVADSFEILTSNESV